MTRTGCSRTVQRNSFNVEEAVHYLTHGDIASLLSSRELLNERWLSTFALDAFPGCDDCDSSSNDASMTSARMRAIIWNKPDFIKFHMNDPLSGFKAAASLLDDHSGKDHDGNLQCAACISAIKVYLDSFCSSLFSELCDIFKS